MEKRLGDVHQLFKDFLVYQRHLASLTTMAVQGIFGLSNMGDFSEGLARLAADASVPGINEAVERFKKRALFAKEEVDRHYPFIFAHSSVAIWGHLEAYVEDLIVCCLENDSGFMALDPIRKVKISLSLYEEMSSTDRKRYIIDGLQRQTQSSFKRGTSQFEAVFACLGLGGHVDTTQSIIYLT